MKEVVVYVDDADLARKVQQILASQPDLVVSTASTPSELGERVHAASIVLTDLAEDLGGLDVLSIVRSSADASKAPVIVLTSRKNEKLAVQALRESATSYVPARLVHGELTDTLDSVFSVANAHIARSRVMQCLTHWQCEFEIENDRTLIAPLVRYLQEALQQMGLLSDPGDETRIGIAIEEALLNAMYHGNLEVSSALREEDDTQFYDMVSQRSSEDPYCNRRVTLHADFDPLHASFVIRDQGPGFDVSTVPDPTDPVNVERVCGRGMLLMRTFMDEVRYNESGNEVRLTKRKASAKQKA